MLTPFHADTPPDASKKQQLSEEHKAMLYEALQQLHSEIVAWDTGTPLKCTYGLVVTQFATLERSSVGSGSMR